MSDKSDIVTTGCLLGVAVAAITAYLVTLTAKGGYWFVTFLVVWVVVVFAQGLGGAIERQTGDQ